MSALNICNKESHCIIMQDAAVYDRNGVVLRFEEKGEIIEGKSMFVCATGSSRAPLAFRFMADNFANIDELAGLGERGFSQYFDRFLDDGILDCAMGVCVAIAGWSPTLRRARCVMFSAELNGAGSIFSSDLGTMSHPTLIGQSREQWTRYHGLGEINIVRFDPMTDGLHLMELQRRQSATLVGGEYEAIVGGHITLTEVRRGRIDRRVVRRWDEDRVGERITPGPMPEISRNVVSIGAGLHGNPGSRHERRRAAKLAKKGRAA